MRVVVGGQSKSGTTALYFAAQAAMPANTVGMFEPTEYQTVYAPHVLAKILSRPEVDWSSFEGFDKQVMIIRDPRDRIVSLTLYGVYGAKGRAIPQADARKMLSLVQRKQQGEHVTLREICDQASSIRGYDLWEKNVERNDWFRRTCEQFPYYHRIRYEDFVRGQHAQLNDYLGFELPRQTEVEATFSRVDRTRTSGDWKNWFTLSDIDYYRPKLVGLMDYLGYEDDWSLPADASVLPQHGTQYLERLFREQRARYSLPRRLRTFAGRTVRALLGKRHAA